MNWTFVDTVGQGPRRGPAIWKAEEEGTSLQIWLVYNEQGKVWFDLSATKIGEGDKVWSNKANARTLVSAKLIAQQWSEELATGKIYK